MKYMTGHVWCGSEAVFLEQDMHQESILLQHIRYGQRDMVFTVVCNGAEYGGYLTGRLKDWFQRNGKELAGKAKNSEVIAKKLQREFLGLKEELGDKEMDLASLLIVDRECFLITCNMGMCYLFNRRFERTHRRRLSCSHRDHWQMRQGCIQKKVGILIGLQPFLEGVDQGAMLQCLAAQDIEKECQISKRLCEIAEESRRQGYHGECSAVYIRSI